MVEWLIKVYVAGYREDLELFLTDVYSKTGVLLNNIGPSIDELITAALSDGMTVKDIVVTPLLKKFD